MGCSIRQCGVVARFAGLVYHHQLGWQVKRTDLTVCQLQYPRPPRAGQRMSSQWLLGSSKYRAEPRSLIEETGFPGVYRLLPTDNIIWGTLFRSPPRTSTRVMPASKCAWPPHRAFLITIGK